MDNINQEPTSIINYDLLFERLRKQSSLAKTAAWAIIIFALTMLAMLAVRSLLAENSDALLHAMFLIYGLTGAMYFAYLGPKFKSFIDETRKVTQFAFLSYLMVFFLYFVGLYIPQIVIEYPSVRLTPYTVNKATPAMAEAGIAAEILPKLKVKPEVTEKAITYEYGENKDVNATFDYIKRFATVAKAEKAKFGIPASITLAQGILESSSGKSRLCKLANNHFGIKGSTELGHVLVHDDAPNEKFRKYGSAWFSFRDHSLLLQKRIYTQYTKMLASTDYKGWAIALKKAGYATEPDYAKSVIDVIEKYKLYKFDE